MLTLEHRPPTEAEIERLREAAAADDLLTTPIGCVGCAAVCWGAVGALCGALVAILVAAILKPGELDTWPWMWPLVGAFGIIGALPAGMRRVRSETDSLRRCDEEMQARLSADYDWGEVTVIRGEPEGAVVLPAYEDEGDTWFLGAGSGQIVALFGQFADDLDEDTFPASRFSLSLLGPHVVLDYQPEGPLLEGITILDPERLKSEVYEAIGRIDIVLYPGRLETCVSDLVSHLADPHL